MKKHFILLLLCSLVLGAAASTAKAADTPPWDAYADGPLIGKSCGDNYYQLSAHSDKGRLDISASFFNNTFGYVRIIAFSYGQPVGELRLTSFTPSHGFDIFSGQFKHLEPRKFIQVVAFPFWQRIPGWSFANRHCESHGLTIYVRQH
jgi:hypothetical protein